MGAAAQGVEYVEDHGRRRWAVWLVSAAVLTALIFAWTGSSDAEEATVAGAVPSGDAPPPELHYQLVHTSWGRGQVDAAAGDDGHDDGDDEDPVLDDPVPPPPGIEDLAARYENTDVFVGGER